MMEATIGGQAQGHAVSLEMMMRKVFKCERGDLGGIINSDYIRSNPLVAIVATCAHIYPQSQEGREKIDSFIESSIQFFGNSSLDDILSNESPKDIENVFINLKDICGL